MRAPLSSDTILALAAAVVVGLVVVWGVRKAQGLAADAADLPGRAWDAVAETVAGAVDAVAETIGAGRQAIADSNPSNPGAGLPAGWYRVQTKWGEVVTRRPDSFKTINPYDNLGLIDP